MRQNKLTVAQAAKQLKISVQGVYEAVKDHRLRAAKGIVKKRVLLISAADLEAFRVSESHRERGKKG